MEQQALGLPVGVSEFAELREKGLAYVDKSDQMWEFVNLPHTLYYMGRPVGFGKTLFLSMLQAYYQGRKELFRGLKVEQLEEQKGEDAWHVYPVLRLDIGKMPHDSLEGIEEALCVEIERFGQRIGYEPEKDELRAPSSMLHRILEWLKEKGEKPVILVDDYRSPYEPYDEDYYFNEIPEVPKDIRRMLTGFYTLFKACQPEIHRLFMTGTKRYRVDSIWGGLNSIMDSSTDDEYEPLFGFDVEEIKAYFDPRVGELAEALGVTKKAAYQQLKETYGGYYYEEDYLRDRSLRRKHAAPRMYHPGGVIQCLASLQLDANPLPAEDRILASERMWC